MALGDDTRVRERIGERIPIGGTDADTMFTDDEINGLLLRNGDVVEAAVAEGWRIKAAEFASLVDTSEGTSKRAMSDLYEHALKMAAESEGNIPGTQSGGTRIYPLKRL